MTKGQKQYPLGAHLSIAGGISNAVGRALDLGVNAFQCFGGNPRGWKQKPLEDDEALRFRQAREKAGIWPVVVHTSYLINLSSPDEALYKKSKELYRVEIERADKIGADYLVTHLGSSRGVGVEFAVKRAVSGVAQAVKEAGGFGVELLFENTAGSGTTTGSDLVDIGVIINELETLDIKTGLCFDTCHAFAAGYRLQTLGEVEALVATIDAAVGLSRLKVIHLNDSKGEFLSKLDRHEHIGKGRIGSFDAFLTHPLLTGLPLILETPKEDEESDIKNLITVRDIIALGYQK